MSNVTYTRYFTMFLSTIHTFYLFIYFWVSLDLMDLEWPHLSMLSPPTGTWWAIQHHQLCLVARASLTITLFS